MFLLSLSLSLSLVSLRLLPSLLSSLAYHRRTKHPELDDQLNLDEAENDDPLGSKRERGVGFESEEEGEESGKRRKLGAEIDPLA